MINRVVLVGRMASDPELKYTPSGVAVATFRIAVDRSRPSQQGERETDFIPIVAWQQNAEFAASYLNKGRVVAIEGRIRVRSWQTQDGQRRRSYTDLDAIAVGLDLGRVPLADAESPDAAPVLGNASFAA